MAGNDQDEALTAAECAARTGLTVRALRVYEDYGLIAPRRSAGGWRYYDAADLVRLNTIGLLKTAGLTLAQIRQVTILTERAPPLQHVLEMQVESWKERRTWAERGQAVAETALQNLKANNSLSVDELCNLVRSLEMSDQNSDAEPRRAAIAVETEILDRYVGTYQTGEYTVFTVTREGGKLVLKAALWPPTEMIPESNTEFVGAISQARYAFQSDAELHVTGVTMSSNGVDTTAPRIDAAAAAAIQARLAERIRSNTPVTGSEAALRRLIEGLGNGTPNYQDMSPAFEQAVRKQLPQMQMIARYLGAIQAIEFKGVGKLGWDSYEVRRENGVALWRISFTNGIVTGAAASLADGP